MQRMEGLDSKTIELFKLKYLKNMLTQYRWGEMIPMVDLQESKFITLEGLTLELM